VKNKDYEAPRYVFSQIQYCFISISKVVPLINQPPRQKDLLRVGGIAPRILDLDTRRMWVVSFTPRGKSPRHPL